MSNVIGELKKIIQTQGLSVLQIAKKTDIPAYRIYKWLGEKAKPKYEDVQTLEKFLSDCMEEKENNGSLEKSGTSAKKEKETEPLLAELIGTYIRVGTNNYMDIFARISFIIYSPC